jgi:hypothetical protein
MAANPLLDTGKDVLSLVLTRGRLQSYPGSPMLFGTFCISDLLSLSLIHLVGLHGDMIRA